MFSVSAEGRNPSETGIVSSAYSSLKTSGLGSRRDECREEADDCRVGSRSVMLSQLSTILPPHEASQCSHLGRRPESYDNHDGKGCM